MAEITLEEMADRWAQVDIPAELPQLVLQTHEVPEAMIKTQHALGQLSTGLPIAPTYASDYYAKTKQLLNPIPSFGTPDIYKSGAYNEALQVVVTGDEYSIESSVSYATAPSLTQYGTDLNRLSDENKTVYSDGAIKDAIISYIQEKTGAEFI